MCELGLSQLLAGKTGRVVCKHKGCQQGKERDPQLPRTSPSPPGPRRFLCLRTSPLSSMHRILRACALTTQGDPWTGLDRHHLLETQNPDFSDMPQGSSKLQCSRFFCLFVSFFFHLQKSVKYRSHLVALLSSCKDCNKTINFVV